MKKPAIVVAVIAAIGSIAVALVGIIPALTGEGKKESGKPPAAEASQVVTAAGNENLAVGVQGSTGNTITVNPVDQRVGDLLNKGLPETSHPVIDLSAPIKTQLQLFAEDKVRIWSFKDDLAEVWFGHHWEPFVQEREYLVWGIPGRPVTPQFRGRGYIKMEITFTKYRNEPRDLRALQGEPVVGR